MVEYWLLSQNASFPNAGTATCIYRGISGLNSREIMAVSNAWPTVMAGEDLVSNHHPILFTNRGVVQAASAPQQRARWNTTSVDWQPFTDTVKEAVGEFPMGPTSLHKNRFKSTLSKQ